MEMKILKNKEGKAYTTKDGKELIEYKFTEGDVFVPLFNKPILKKNENAKFEEFTIKCKIKDKDGKKFGEENNEGVFVKLTKAQYEKLLQLSEIEELTQNKYVAYEYENKYGKQIGLGKMGSGKDPIALD